MLPWATVNVSFFAQSRRYSLGTPACWWGQHPLVRVRQQACIFGLADLHTSDLPLCRRSSIILVAPLWSCVFWRCTPAFEPVIWQLACLCDVHAHLPWHYRCAPGSAGAPPVTTVTAVAVPAGVALETVPAWGPRPVAFGTAPSSPARRWDPRAQCYVRRASPRRPKGCVNGLGSCQHIERSPNECRLQKGFTDIYRKHREAACQLQRSWLLKAGMRGRRMTHYRAGGAATHPAQEEMPSSHADATHQCTPQDANHNAHNGTHRQTPAASWRGLRTIPAFQSAALQDTLI